jgi:Fungal specific transcription factor domain
MISSCSPCNSQCCDFDLCIIFYRALDLLFKFFTSWCLRIVPDLFLRDMYRALNVPPSQTPPKTLHYSPMLHNALVALALAFLDEPFKDLKTRQCYAIHAESFIEAECWKPNPSAVSALSVLASFYSSQGDQTARHRYFGMTFLFFIDWNVNVYLV